MTQWGIDALFNPAKRHMDDEKRRLQSTREQIGDSSGGRRIDLDSGKVKIRRPELSDEVGEDDAAEPEADAEPEPEAQPEADAERADSEAGR